MRVFPWLRRYGSSQAGKILCAEQGILNCVWVLSFVDLRVEPHEEHGLGPQRTVGMGYAGREREPVCGSRGDVDIVEAVGVPIADQGGAENQGHFRPSHMVMIAAHCSDLCPHDVYVPLGGQQSECEWLDDKPACIAGRSETLGDSERKHGALTDGP
jgi:hypothetical protein